MTSRHLGTVSSGPGRVWTADAFNRGRPILVLAPHPDDECLGCGALLAACFETVGAHVVCVTDGRLSHPKSVQWPGSRLAACRELELIDAVETLGGCSGDVTFLRYPDCGAPQERREQRSAAIEIAGLCRKLGAGALFATSEKDQHKDHQAVAAIAREVCAVEPGLRLFHYSIWGRWQAGVEPCEFSELRFKTGPWRRRKAAAIAAHRSQLGQVVQDDPGGFVMPDGFAAFFTDADEAFVEVTP